MTAYSYDSGSSWSDKDQRRIHYMNPVSASLGLEVILRNFNLSTGAYEGPITLNEVDDVVLIGAQANVVGSGIAITSSRTYALKACSDDVGASIASSVRGIQSRFLLTVDQTGGSIRALQGQLKLADGVDVTSGIYTANQGYVELMGDHSAKTGSTFSCFDASLEIASAKTLTIDSGGEACGVHIETTGAGSITNNGTCAALLISNASGAPDWPVGIDLTDSCTTGIDIGACTTGISFTGAFTTGISIAADGTTAISVTSAFSGTTGLSFAGTATNGIAISGACSTAAVNISGAEAVGLSINTSTPVDGILISAACANAIEISGAATTYGINISADCQTAINVVAQTGTGITVGACATAFEASGACSAAGLSIMGVCADGVAISGACTDGIEISGACTTAGINISGAEAIGLSINTSTPTDGINIAAACANAIAITGANTSAGISISGAHVNAHIAHLGKWGENFNYGCMTIAGDLAGTALAWGSATGNVCVQRVNMTAQVGTAEGYVIAKYQSIGTSGAGAGTVLQHGIWMGDYTKLTIAHNTTDAYATRGRTLLSGTLAGNQFIGVMGQIEITGAATLEATGGGYGVYGSITSSGSGTCNRNVAAGYFTMRPNTINLAGTMACVVADMGGSGYSDYGFLANCGNNNLSTAMIGLVATDSAVVPVGISFVPTAGSITNAFSFPAAGIAPVSSGGTVGTHGTSTVKIAILINDVTHYLLASTVPTFT